MAYQLMFDIGLSIGWFITHVEPTKRGLEVIMLFIWKVLLKKNIGAWWLSLSYYLFIIYYFHNHMYTIETLKIFENSFW